MAALKYQGLEIFCLPCYLLSHLYIRFICEQYTSVVFRYCVYSELMSKAVNSHLKIAYSLVIPPLMTQ